MRRFSIFVVGAALGVALLLCSAFAGLLGFASVEGAALSALLLFALVAADVVIGGLLVRALLSGASSSRGGGRSEGLFVGGALFAGAFVGGLLLGTMILLDTPPAARTLYAYAAGPGLGLVYGMVLGVPAVVGATIVELRFYSRGGDNSPRRLS
ncbi:MAG: hypothetical protein AVDCRST_MAG28-1411 [uncultured Rubrobacteraceae bacterium]|uniref:Uncharacterized protein n=1 Tax=uncultured Rubrobacteraceae bacterium TaxID=349277 RepID=A0A6J4QPN7_9ACTN|nr:MAG: hypothetical protein AVDCRST_MAG28-1411 [uncultured Rubrobacteraceae bacterium]